MEGMRKAEALIRVAVAELEQSQCGGIASELRAWAKRRGLWEGVEQLPPAPVEELVRDQLAWASPERVWRWKTATEVLLEIGVDKPDATDAAKAGAIIRKMNGGQSRRNKGRNQVFVPPRIGAAFATEYIWGNDPGRLRLRGDQPEVVQ